MKLSAAGNGSIVVDVAGETWAIPPLPMSAVIDWAAEIDARRADDFRRNTEAITDGERRFHHLNAYGPRAASVFDVQDAGALTPAGILRVVRHCLPAAKVTARGGHPVTPEPVTADAAEAVIAANTPESLCLLSRKLLGLPDPVKPAPAKPADDEKGEDESPLTPGSTPTPPTPSGG